jgi:hypothetical protein
MNVDVLLSRLDRARRIGGGRWVACCPCHESNSGASLAIRELDDGSVLLHDFGGCPTDEVLAAIGIDFDELFPSRVDDQDRRPRQRFPFSAADALRCLSFEVWLLATWRAVKCSIRPTW